MQGSTFVRGIEFRSKMTQHYTGLKKIVGKSIAEEERVREKVDEEGRRCKRSTSAGEHISETG
ncbi:MAG: hypothetical protein IMY88_01245 [Chloroflexi bacterium]|nr:hypothetical protein [Chloroflexota bacterium]